MVFLKGYLTATVLNHMQASQNIASEFREMGKDLFLSHFRFHDRKNDGTEVREVQQKLLARVAELFLPLIQRSGASQKENGGVNEFIENTRMVIIDGILEGKKSTPAPEKPPKTNRDISQRIELVEYTGRTVEKKVRDMFAELLQKGILAQKAYIERIERELAVSQQENVRIGQDLHGTKRNLEAVEWVNSLLVRELDKKTSQLGMTIERGKQTREKLSGKISAMEEAAIESENERRQLELHEAELTHSLSLAEKRLNTLENAAQESTQEIQNVRARLSLAETDVQRIQTELRNVRTDLRIKTADGMRYWQSISQAQKSLQDAGYNGRNLEEQIRSAVKKLNELDGTEARWRTEVQKNQNKEAEIERLEAEIAVIRNQRTTSEILRQSAMDDIPLTEDHKEEPPLPPSGRPSRGGSSVFHAPGDIIDATYVEIARPKSPPGSNQDTHA